MRKLFNSNRRNLFRILLVWFLVVLLFKFFRNDSQNHQNFDQPVLGYYASDETNQEIHRWWRCAGNSFYLPFIRSLEISLELPPFEEVETQYISQSIYNAISTWNNNNQIEAIRPLFIEKWRDYTNGINGLMDMELHFNNNTKSNTTLEFHTDQSTTVQVKPLLQKTSKIHFITPVYNRYTHFIRYLNSVKKVSEYTEKEFEVCIIDYEGDDTDTHDLIRKFKFNKNVKFTIVNQDLPFAKAVGLMACINKVKNEDDIIFIMDVDVSFPQNVLDKVYRYIEKNKRIYAPIVYYQKELEDGTIVEDWEGYAFGGTGIVAIYLNDIKKFGGFDLKTFSSSHGFEDTDFFFSARYLKMQVARPKEREFIHYPHGRSKGWEINGGGVEILQCTQKKPQIQILI